MAATSHVRVTNWNNSSPVMISKGTVVGSVEEVTPVDQEDPVWKGLQLCCQILQ